MSDVFISYKREDESRVGPLVLALEKQGLLVWWDRGLPGGEQWRANIEAALDQAKCVVVAWTEASTGTNGAFVKDEAARGAQRNILVPVLLERVAPPLGFGELQAIDLTRWRGSARDPFLEDLVAAIRAKLEGRPVPPPQGPIRLLRRRLSVGGAISAITVALRAFASNSLNLQDKACGMPWAYPWLSDACGALDLGHRPTKSERLAWERRPEGDCAALREHILRFPAGVYRDTAQALLSARTVTSVESWTPVQRALRLLVGVDELASPTQDVARRAALERGRKKAEVICQDFPASGFSRYKGATAEPEDWVCNAVRGGEVCGFEGKALCLLEEKSIVESESCLGLPAK